VTIDDRRRLQLYEAARTSFGEDAAGTLMEMLPVDHSELASKQDVSVLAADLRSDMSALRGELRSEMSALRGELRSDLSALRAEMHDLFREQTNRILMFVLPTMLSGIGLAFAAARLG
jgi:hypothetical protein